VRGAPAEGCRAVGPLDAFGEGGGLVDQVEEASLSLQCVHLFRLPRGGCVQQVWAVGCENSPQPTCPCFSRFLSARACSVAARTT